MQQIIIHPNEEIFKINFNPKTDNERQVLHDNMHSENHKNFLNALSSILAIRKLHGYNTITFEEKLCFLLLSLKKVKRIN